MWKIITRVQPCKVNIKFDMLAPKITYMAMYPKNQLELPVTNICLTPKFLILLLRENSSSAEANQTKQGRQWLSKSTFYLFSSVF